MSVKHIKIKGFQLLNKIISIELRICLKQNIEITYIANTRPRFSQMLYKMEKRCNEKILIFKRKMRAAISNGNIPLTAAIIIIQIRICRNK